MNRSAQPVGSSRYTWRELRERAEQEEHLRHQRSALHPTTSTHYSEVAAERLGRAMFGQHN